MKKYDVGVIVVDSSDTLYIITRARHGHVDLVGLDDYYYSIKTHIDVTGYPPYFYIVTDMFRSLI